MPSALLSPPLPRPLPCSFPLAVEPSHLPVALQVLRDGQPLPTKEVEGEEGPAQVALLEGIPAGSPGELRKGRGTMGLLPAACSLPVPPWCLCVLPTFFHLPCAHAFLFFQPRSQRPAHRPPG